MINYKLAALLILYAVIATSCNTKDTPVSKTNSTKQQTAKLARLESPARNASFTLGDQFNLVLTYEDSLQLDSLQVFFRGQLAGVYSETESVTVSTAGKHPGSAGLRVKLFFTNGMDETCSSMYPTTRIKYAVDTPNAPWKKGSDLASMNKVEIPNKTRNTQFNTAPVKIKGRRRPQRDVLLSLIMPKMGCAIIATANPITLMVPK